VEPPQDISQSASGCHLPGYYLVLLSDLLRSHDSARPHIVDEREFCANLTTIKRMRERMASIVVSHGRRALISQRLEQLCNMFFARTVLCIQTRVDPVLEMAGALNVF